MTRDPARSTHGPISSSPAVPAREAAILVMLAWHSSRCPSAGWWTAMNT